LIDQHAAHERILFEEIVNSFKNAKVPSQRLLQPVALSLTEMEKQILKDNWDMLLNFGFDLEEFGGLSIALKGVPHIFKNPENVGFFTEILDLLGSGKVENLYDAKVDTMATIACKAAVKGNDKLSVQDAVSLIERLLKLENPFNCPHGRPTIVEITKNEFEKYFKRIV
ncbi:MAG: DNA mismatch repair endonuclease MutL, partial [Anaerotignaceae bacterium]